MWSLGPIAVAGRASIASEVILDAYTEGKAPADFPVMLSIVMLCQSLLPLAMVVPSFLWGLVHGLARVRSGSILPSIALHMAWNAIVFGLYAAMVASARP